MFVCVLVKKLSAWKLTATTAVLAYVTEHFLSLGVPHPLLVNTLILRDQLGYVLLMHAIRNFEIPKTIITDLLPCRLFEFLFVN